jgi:hypothetical protein
MLVTEQLARTSKYFFVKYAHKAKASKSFKRSQQDQRDALDWIYALEQVRQGLCRTYLTILPLLTHSIDRVQE